MIIRQYKNRKLYAPNKGYITLKKLLQIISTNDGVTVLNGERDVTRQILAESLKHLGFTREELFEIIKVKLSKTE